MLVARFSRNNLHHLSVLLPPAKYVIRNPPFLFLDCKMDDGTNKDITSSTLYSATFKVRALKITTFVR